MIDPRVRLATYLEEHHRRAVAAANARQRARDLALGHSCMTTKPLSSDGGAVRSTPAPHPTPRPDEPKEIQ